MRVDETNDHSPITFDVQRIATVEMLITPPL